MVTGKKCEFDLRDCVRSLSSSLASEEKSIVRLRNR